MIDTSSIRGTCLAEYPLGRHLSDSAKRALSAARPQRYMAHGGPHAIMAFADHMIAEAKAIVPGIVPMIGIGCDVWVEQVIKDEVTMEAAVDAIADCADLAVACGCDAVVPDPESSSLGDQPADHLRHTLAGQFAVNTLAEIRRRHPTLAIGHTSYPDPVRVTYQDAEGHTHGWGGNSGYPWREWTQADFDVPQFYWSPSRGVAPAGTGPFVHSMDVKSWDAAVSASMVRNGIPLGAYVQLHGAVVRDTCAVADAYALRCGWAAGSDTMDALGLCSLSVLAELSRRGMRLVELQRALGIKPDGIVGEMTCHALGIAWPT